MEITMTRCDNHDALVQEVNPDLLQVYWLQLRCTGPDIFTINKYNGSEKRDIQRGWMPRNQETTIEELKECVKELDALNAFIDKYSNRAREDIINDYDFYETRQLDTNCYCIYCKCSDGIIGVGWRFRDGDLVKARMMAAFTLYVYGLQSADSDPLLWDIAYRHLPFAMNMDLTLADKVFVKFAL